MKGRWLSLACGMIALGIASLTLPMESFAGWARNSSKQMPGVAVQTSEIESVYGGVPSNFNQCVSGVFCTGVRPGSSYCVSPCPQQAGCTDPSSGCPTCTGNIANSTCSGPFTGISCYQNTTSCCTVPCKCRYMLSDLSCTCVNYGGAYAIGVYMYC
jgi:hypothetical protein